MNRFRRITTSFLPLLILILFSVNADAALKAVGPTDPVTTLPAYYQDLSNLAVQPCLDQNGMCLLPGGFDKLGNPVVPNFDPAFSPPLPLVPITTTAPISDANFPGEGFYYSATAIMPIEGGELANLAYVLEYAFLAGVSPDTAIVFLRTDLQKMINLSPDSTYRVTHPYGTFDFTTDGAGNARGGGGVVLRQEDPAGGAGAAVGYFSPSFKSAPNTNIGPFLRPADGILITKTVGAETHTYLGDPAATTLVNGVPTAGVPVTGGTNGNIFKIDRIVTGGTPVSQQSSWSTDLFSVSARIFTGNVASPMTIDHATYSRDASSGQVDIFVTAVSGATLTVNGNGIPATLLTEDTPGSGKFFAHIPFTTTLPSAMTITNSLDLPSPVAHPFALSDEVNITKALYDPVSKNLTVTASSRDKLVVPTLTAPQFAAPNTLTGGTLVKSLSTTIPPETVTVTSSSLGTATAQVSVVTPPPPPVAVNDDAVTAMNSPVTVIVLTNDTAAGGINSTTVAVVDAPASGASTTVNPNGTISYTPVAAFNGSETFTYRFQDNFDQFSNAATVNVTVHRPPVAVDDSASAAINTTVNIPVIGNDGAFSSSINATTVNIVSSASCGSTTVLPNGTVNFAAPASVPVPGNCSFSYIVSDTFSPPSVSNVATVTITITEPPAPVAVDDVAIAISGSSVAINVLDNDSSLVSTINPATLSVTAPTAGIAAANQNGAVIYTAPSTPGTYTFTYSVKDIAVPPLTSNVATVTVTVIPAAAPVAVDDTTSVSVGSTTQLNVLANDTTVAPATINTTSIAVTQPTGAILPNTNSGSAIANANGTVSYTAPDVPGTYTFTYTVNNNNLPALTSNQATVTVNVVPTKVSLVVSPPAPQLPQTPITFVAAGSGGSGSYEYQFSIKTTGNGYSITQPYSSTNSWTWTPADTGPYDIKVDIRSAGSPVDSEAAAYYFYYQIETPATSVTLVAEQPAPQPPGTPVTFTASATGGSGPYEYRFWINNGNGYAVTQEYGSSNTFVWTPTKPGIYDIMVDTRAYGSNVLRDAYITLLSYQVSPPPATAVTLTPQIFSPQPVGTPITFTAAASGGTGPYEYRFWINVAGTYVIAQDYTPFNTFTWTPLIQGNYDIMVDTRSIGSVDFREALDKIFFYQIQ